MKKKQNPELEMSEKEKAKQLKAVNRKNLRNALASVNLPAIDISDEAQVAQRIKEYFAWCVEQGKIPQKVEMSNWLGVSMQMVNSWANNARGTKLAHQEVIQKAESILHSLWYDSMQNGTMNPVTGIFLGKNMFGYKDSTEVAVAAGPLGDTPTQKELEDKLSDLVIDSEIVQPKALTEAAESAGTAESVKTSIYKAVAEKAAESVPGGEEG